MHTDPDLKLLAEADPAADVSLSPIESHHLLRTTLDASPSATSPARGWRNRVVRVGIGAVALGIAVPALAFAGNYLAQTGMFNHPGGENGPGTSEMIDILAPDYVDYAVTQWPDYVTLPASFDVKEFARTRAQATHDAFVASNAAEEHPSDASYMAADGVKLDFEIAARCVWLNQWLDADARGDAAATAESAAKLDEAATWKYTVVFFTKEPLAGVRRVADAASAGDRAVVQADAADCPAYTRTPDGGR